MANKSKYKPEYAEWARKFCLIGAIDTQLAEYFQVNPDTIYTWKKAHPEFKAAIDAGRQYADAHVGESLYQRATGYSHPEEKIFLVDGEVIRVDTIKHYPPDTGAAIFWLKNRQGWRDKQDVEHSGDVKLSWQDDGDDGEAA